MGKGFQTAFALQKYSSTLCNEGIQISHYKDGESVVHEFSSGKLPIGHVPQLASSFESSMLLGSVDVV